VPLGRGGPRLALEVGVTSNSDKGFSLLEIVIVLGVMGVLLAVAVPRMSSGRSGDDTHNLSNALSLAKLRAASNFNHSRLYVEITNRRHHIDSLNGAAWVALNGPTPLSNGVAFTSAPVGTPPPNTQAGAPHQAVPCLDNLGVAIAGTACIEFNSRGIPIDSTNAPTNDDALYVTDGRTVGAVTVSAAGLITVWNTASQATPSWTRK
jgi:prepilin-type N-terminal cleavage/methylation domain-containing protein